MPARNQPRFPSPDRDPDENIVPSELVDDDALWMLLNAYADGEATAAEVLRVEGLLRSHPGVAREFSFLQLTADSVREFGEIEPPSRMTGAIFAATARRKTLLQRVGGWWTSAGTAFGPPPVRFVGAALACGVLAVVLWSRHGAVQSVERETAPPMAARQLRQRESVTNVARGPQKVNTTVASVPYTFVPLGPGFDGAAALIAANPYGPIGPLQSAAAGTERPNPIVKPLRPHVVVPHRDSPSRIARADAAATGVVVTHPNVEERHMAADSDANGKTAKPDELGPDFDTPTEVHTDETAKVTPPASYDEPPTTVTAVSYRLGSISDKTRNAPPAVQSLYMRTQDAIRRQHEIQQYGGYGRDAYNNIQRGEVGLSLVGGRF